MLYSTRVPGKTVAELCIKDGAKEIIITFVDGSTFEISINMVNELWGIWLPPEQSSIASKNMLV